MSLYSEPGKGSFPGQMEFTGCEYRFKSSPPAG